MKAPPTLLSATARDGRKFVRNDRGAFEVKSEAAPTLGNFTHFQALKRAGWKGWFFVPDLAPMRRMNQMTRDQINRAGQWLYDNVGFASSLVDRLAIYEAGAGMWPKATSESPEFNRALTDLFHQGVRDPRFFDMAKVESFYSAQVSIRRHIRMYGDHFGMLVRGPVPRMKFIPGFMVKNPLKAGYGSEWSDGVKTDEHGAITSYCVWTSLDGSTSMEVPAEDMLHFHDHFFTGQTRGLSIFARVAEKMFTIDDICRAEANGMLARARMGYALQTAENDGDDPKFAVPGAEDEPEEVENTDGSSFTIQRIKFPGGDVMDIPQLPAGYKIDVVESNRPGPNQQAFIDELKRDMAHASNYLPEFCAFIADSGGAVTRFVIEDSQMIIDDKRLNQLEPQYTHRFFIFCAWQRIKSGQFDAIGVPKDWWRYRMIYPRRNTVDKKNDGRLDDSRVETGKMSPEQYHGQVGDDAEDVEDEIIAARLRREEKVAVVNTARTTVGLPEIPYEEFFRPPVGGMPPASQEPEPPDDEPPSKKKEKPADDPPPPPPKKK